ncbi:MAG: YdeI/OmpD-associated family protein [Cyanobacteria bacterium J06633_23]
MPLLWIKSAKQASTRANRITKTVELAAQNVKANG